MKQAIIGLLCILTIIACNNKKEEDKQVGEVSVEETKMPETVNDSAAIRSVIIDFYTWYTANYKQMMSYDLYTSLKKNNEAPYKINWEEVKRYLTFIQDSVPQLGDEFVSYHKQMFAKADSAFKVDLDEDVPVYFDYDWFTNSQESPEYLLNGLRRSTKWIIKVNGNDAAVEIGSPDDKDYLAGSLLLYVGMKKENGKWTIAKIGND